MFNTEWRIHKASNYKWEDRRIINNAVTFMSILQELYDNYKCDVIINLEDHTLTIYDDYME